jgi:hypothetical protein
MKLRIISKKHLAIAKYCDGSKLHVTKYSKGVWQKPKENYCVEKDGKITILKWFKEVIFSYAHMLLI